MNDLKEARHENIEKFHKAYKAFKDKEIRKLKIALDRKREGEHSSSRVLKET